MFFNITACLLVFSSLYKNIILYFQVSSFPFKLSKNLEKENMKESVVLQKDAGKKKGKWKKNKQINKFANINITLKIFWWTQLGKCPLPTSTRLKLLAWMFQIYSYWLVTLFNRILGQVTFPAFHCQTDVSRWKHVININRNNIF